MDLKWKQRRREKKDDVESENYRVNEELLFAIFGLTRWTPNTHFIRGCVWRRQCRKYRNGVLVALLLLDVRPKRGIRRTSLPFTCAKIGKICSVILYTRQSKTHFLRNLFLKRIRTPLDGSPHTRSNQNILRNVSQVSGMEASKPFFTSHALRRWTCDENSIKCKYLASSQLACWIWSRLCILHNEMASCCRRHLHKSMHNVHTS